MTPPLESQAPGPLAGVDYLERVQALAPLIVQSADAIERERRLPAALVAGLKEADFFRMLLPRPFGGGEIDPVTFVRVIEAVAKLDASTAWILGQTAVTAMVAARLEPDAAWQIWRDPGAVLAWGPSTDSRAVPVAGGYRVSGTFAFASGCRHATWLGGDCTLAAPDGTPLRTADGKPEQRRVLFPASLAVMRDLWNVVGLKGTASDGYTVTDLFVPDALTVTRIDDPAALRYRSRLYAMSAYSMFACGFAMLALGVTRSLVDAFVELAQEKTPRGYRSRLRDDAMTQAELGYAEARLRAARIYLMGTLAEAWDEAGSGVGVSLASRMAMRLAATYAIRQGKAVADTIFDAAGTTAIFVSNAFERRFRDIHTVAQQLQGRTAHYRTVGQYLLGLEGELGWV
ncbi:MAG TPA: acyl-CoA dehydrogenase family protein [Stellaceae bacterium]|nr:acyl-CoA dehydrogenase family protein [Stellaceae bacterium]